MACLADEGKDEWVAIFLFCSEVLMAAIDRDDLSANDPLNHQMLKMIQVRTIDILSEFDFSFFAERKSESDLTLIDVFKDVVVRNASLDPDVIAVLRVKAKFTAVGVMTFPFEVVGTNSCIEGDHF